MTTPGFLKKTNFSIFHELGDSVKGNLLTISLTISSSGPVTLLSSLALACNTKSTVIAALRPSSVHCRSPTFLCEVFNSVFLHFSRPLLISVHFSTLPLQFLLQFFPVLCAIAFHIQLTLLPLCSSTLHQTNVEIAQNGSEDNLLISRIRSLHLLLEIDDHDEEEW